MSLESPTTPEKALAFITAHRTYFIIGGLTLLLIIVAMWMTDCGSGYLFNRGVKQLQANVNKAVDDAAVIKKQAEEIEKRKIEANANVNAAMSEYQRNTFGREQDKAVTNQALANFNKAMATNGDIDRTAEDLKRQAERLGNQ
jgi:hypothetical protein